MTDTALEALRQIATETYTAQILMEDGATPEEEAETWARLALHYRKLAGDALRALGWTCSGGVYSPPEVPSLRPKDCECDHTHEQNHTCCYPCWEAGFRTVAPKVP